MSSETRLPIWEAASAIKAQLENTSRLVLSAPTGSGKTTQVPQMLASWGLSEGRVLVIEPRRLAARAMARRVAEEMGVEIGEGVGFTTRFRATIHPAGSNRICDRRSVLAAVGTGSPACGGWCGGSGRVP